MDCWETERLYTRHQTTISRNRRQVKRRPERWPEMTVSEAMPTPFYLDAAVPCSTVSAATLPWGHLLATASASAAAAHDRIGHPLNRHPSFRGGQMQLTVYNGYFSGSSRLTEWLRDPPNCVYSIRQVRRGQQCMGSGNINNIEWSNNGLRL